MVYSSSSHPETPQFFCLLLTVSEDLKALEQCECGGPPFALGPGGLDRDLFQDFSRIFNPISRPIYNNNNQRNDESNSYVRFLSQYISHLNTNIGFVGKASAENSRPTSSQCDALRRIVSLSISCFQRKLCYIFCICF